MLPGFIYHKLRLPKIPSWAEYLLMRAGILKHQSEVEVEKFDEELLHLSNINENALKPSRLGKEEELEKYKEEIRERMKEAS